MRKIKAKKARRIIEYGVRGGNGLGLFFALVAMMLEWSVVAIACVYFFSFIAFGVAIIWLQLELARRILEEERPAVVVKGGG